MNIFSKKGSQKPEGENKRLSLIKKKVASSLLPSSSNFGNHNSHSESKSGFSVYSVNSVSLDSNTLSAVNSFAPHNDSDHRRFSYVPNQSNSSPSYEQTSTEGYKTTRAAPSHQNARRIIQTNPTSNHPQSFYNPGPRSSLSSSSSFQNSKNVNNFDGRSMSNDSTVPSFENKNENNPSSISSKTPYSSYLNNSSSSLTKASFSNNSRTPAYISNSKQVSNKSTPNNEWSAYDSNPMLKTNPKYSQNLNLKKSRTNSIESNKLVEKELKSNRSTNSNLLNSIDDANFDDSSGNVIISRGSKSPRVNKTSTESIRSYSGSINRNEFETKDNDMLKSKQRQQNAISSFNANFLAATSNFDHRRASFDENNEIILDDGRFNDDDFSKKTDNETCFIDDSDTFPQSLKDPSYDKYDPLSTEYPVQNSQFPENISMFLPNSGVFDQEDVILPLNLPKINDDSVKPFEAYLNQAYTKKNYVNDSTFKNSFAPNDLLGEDRKESQIDEEIYDDAITPLPNYKTTNQHKSSFVSHKSSDSTNSIQNFFGSFLATESDQIKNSDPPAYSPIDNRSILNDTESISGLKSELKKEIELDLKKEIEQEILSELKVESKLDSDAISNYDTESRASDDHSNFDELQYNKIIKGIDNLTYSDIYHENSNALSDLEQDDAENKESEITTEIMDSDNLRSSHAKLSETNLKSVANFFYPDCNTDETNDESKLKNLEEVYKEEPIQEYSDSDNSLKKVNSAVSILVGKNNVNDKDSQFGSSNIAVSASHELLEDQRDLKRVNANLNESVTIKNTSATSMDIKLLEENLNIQPSQTIIRKKNYLSEIEALANESYEYSDQDLEEVHAEKLNDNSEQNLFAEENTDSLDSYPNVKKENINMENKNKAKIEEILTAGSTGETAVNELSNNSESSKSDNFKAANINENDFHSEPPKSIRKKISLTNINKMKTIRYVRKPIPKDDYEETSNSEEPEDGAGLEKGSKVADMEKTESQNNVSILNASSDHSHYFEKGGFSESISGNSFSSIDNMHNNNNFDYYNVCRNMASMPSKEEGNIKTQETHKTCNIQSDAKKSETGILWPSRILASNEMLSNITDEDFAKCKNIYNLSEIYIWLCTLTEITGASIFTVSDMLLLLRCLIQFRKFLDPQPAMSIAVTIISELISQKCFYSVQGSKKKEKALQLLYKKDPKAVIVDLTPCISYLCLSSIHPDNSCYSTFCPFTKLRTQLTIRNIAVDSEANQEELLKDNWIEHWKIKDETLSLLDKNVIEYQSRVFDLVRKQYDFLKEAEYMVNVLGNEFLHYKDMASIVSPHSIEEVYSFMFEPVKPLIFFHREYLFEPMMKIINVQKTYVKNGIFALYKTWTKKVFPFYIKYIDGLAKVLFLMNFEKYFKKDSQFLNWLKSVSTTEVSPMKLLSNHFFYGLVQYKNSLQDIKSTMNSIDPEFTELVNSHKIIFKFCEKIDERLGRAQVYTLFNSLIWSDQSKQSSLDYNIDKIDLLYEEKVQLFENDASCSNQYNLILLSNSLLLVKVDMSSRKFEIIDKPIPINLIDYEAIDQPSSISVGDLSGPIEKPKGNLKICWLGSFVKWSIYFLKASSRGQWIQLIDNTKNEAFNTALQDLQLLLVASNMPQDDNAVNSRNTSCIMDKNSREKFISVSFQATDKINCPEVQEVFCVITFNLNQQKIYLMGTDLGMFVRTLSTSWRCICNDINVTKIQYIPQADSIVYLADKNFFQVYCSDIDIENLKFRSTKLSKKQVDNFLTGVFQGMFCLFYMKIKVESPLNTISTFKLLIWDDRRKCFKESSLMQSFFLPIECFGWSVFDNMIIFNTSKGFQMMDNNLKPISVPRFFALKDGDDRKKFEIFSKIESRVMKEKSIAAFEIKPRALTLLVFASFSVFCNEYGFISNTFLLNFNIEAKSATIFRNKLLIISNESVMEVYDLTKSPPELVGDILGNGIKMINERNGQKTQDLLIEISNPNNHSKMIVEFTSI